MSYSIENALKEHGRLMQVSSKFAWRKSLYSLAAFVNNTQNALDQTQGMKFRDGVSLASKTLNYLQNDLSAIRRSLLRVTTALSKNDPSFFSLPSEYMKNDAWTVQHLFNEGFISKMPRIRAGLAMFSQGTSVLPVNGSSFVHMSSDFNGKVEITTPQKNVADVFYTRMFALTHELGHSEMELIKEKFRPSFSVCNTQEESLRLTSALNKWVFTRAVGGDSVLYRQFGEAYADAFATLVMKKSFPESQPVLEKIAAYRQKDTIRERKRGIGYFIYMPCPDAIAEAMSVDVSKMSPQDLAEKASVIASNAWLKSATCGYAKTPPVFKPNGEIKRVFTTPWDVTQDYMKHLTQLNFKTLASRLLLEHIIGDKNEIEKTKAFHKDHPAFPILEKVYDKIEEQIHSYFQKNDIQEVRNNLLNGEIPSFLETVDEVFPAWSTKGVNRHFDKPLASESSSDPQQFDLFEPSTLKAPPKASEDYSVDWYETLKLNDPSLLQSMIDDIHFVINVGVNDYSADPYEKVSPLSLSRLKERLKPSEVPSPSISAPRLT